MYQIVLDNDVGQVDVPAFTNDVHREVFAQAVKDGVKAQTPVAWMLATGLTSKTKCSGDSYFHNALSDWFDIQPHPISGPQGRFRQKSNFLIMSQSEAKALQRHRQD